MKKSIIATATAALMVAASIAVAPLASAAPAECTPVDGRSDALNCMIPSEAMGRSIPAVVRPGSDKVIQFFGGISGTDGWSGRTDDNGRSVLDHVEDDDSTIVFLTSEERSFFVDWDSPAAPNNTVMKYETYVTEEVPAYLEENFGIANGGRGNTGLVGLSMSGYGVINLASKNPELYKSVLAISGFYNNQGIIGRAAIDGSGLTHAGDITGSPWDDEISRAEDNPWFNIDGLTMPVHMTASTGIPHETDREDYDTTTLVQGAALEAGVLGGTLAWDMYSSLRGKDNVNITYIPEGIHNWNLYMRVAFTEYGMFWDLSDDF